MVSGAVRAGDLFDAFPQMRDTLREDVALGELSMAWNPPSGPANLWGTVDSVR